MKNICLLCLFIFLICSQLLAQDFRSQDLDGTWKRNDGMIISIDGTNIFDDGSVALIKAVGSSGWSTTQINYGYKFTNIKYKGGNMWKGVNYTWMANSTIGFREENGVATFLMSEDKQSFRSVGGTYSRIR